MKKKRLAVVNDLCVACGTCLKTCPLKAISITDGRKARVNKEKCVGCGKCSKVCPASVIEIVTLEVEHEGEK